ncbi:hypothetical protein [Pararhizobium antarcticum]|nr:hypothetical protein [Pararhizobium antarcticum]
MAILLLSITMFFLMIFATVNAIRTESRAENRAMRNTQLMN